MEKEKLIQKMIKDYEQVISLVSQKLEELKLLARQNNINIDKSVTHKVADVLENPMLKQIKEQREAMMQEMQKVREAAQAQTQKAISDISSNLPSSQSPVVSNSMGMGMGMQGMGVPNMDMSGMPGVNFPLKMNPVVKEEVKKEKEEQKDDK